jgi:hypothetical protein
MRMLDAAEDDHDLILKMGQKSLKGGEECLQVYGRVACFLFFPRYSPIEYRTAYHCLLALQLPLQHDILVRVLIC